MKSFLFIFLNRKVKVSKRRTFFMSWCLETLNIDVSKTLLSLWLSLCSILIVTLQKRPTEISCANKCSFVLTNGAFPTNGDLFLLVLSPYH